MTRPTRGSILLLAAAAAIAATVVVALRVVGSPADERERRADRRRVDDLRAMALAVDRYWGQHQRLAASVGDLIAEGGSALTVLDPTTAEPYEYRTLGGKAYEVCARFHRDSADTGTRPDDFWKHGQGRQCFRLEASPLPK